MKIPKTPIEFDYDLWTTEDGKCMVRVKATGEVTEVDREIMKALRAEEKKLRRSYGSDGNSEDEDSEEKPSGADLSLDALPDDDVKTSAWLADPHDFTNDITAQMLEAELIASLTDVQLDLYRKCIVGGKPPAQICAGGRHQLQVRMEAQRTDSEKSKKNFWMRAIKRQKNVRCKVKGLIRRLHGSLTTE